MNEKLEIKDLGETVIFRKWIGDEKPAEVATRNIVEYQEEGLPEVRQGSVVHNDSLKGIRGDAGLDSSDPETHIQNL